MSRAMRDDALRILKFDVSLSEVLGNHAGLPLKSLAQGGLAGSQTVQREPQASAAAGETNAKRSGRIRLKQDAAVGIRDRDRMVQHRAKHGVQTKLRMQQHCCFKE